MALAYVAYPAATLDVARAARLHPTRSFVMFAGFGTILIVITAQLA